MIQYKEPEMEHVPEVKRMNLYIGVSDIKKEYCEFVETETENELLLSLTSHCDLPTLKDESIDDPSYLDQSYKGKQNENIFKPSKYTTTHVSKKRKTRYPCPVCSKNFSSSKATLNHIYGHFGKRSAIGRKTESDYTSAADIEADFTNGDCDEFQESTRLNECIEKGLETRSESKNEQTILHNLEPLRSNDKLENYPSGSSINTDNFPIQYENNTHIIESDLVVRSYQEESALARDNPQQHAGDIPQKQQFNKVQTRFEDKNLLVDTAYESPKMADVNDTSSNDFRSDFGKSDSQINDPDATTVAGDNPQQHAGDVAQQQRFNKDQTRFEDNNLEIGSASETSKIADVKDTSNNDLSNESGKLDNEISKKSETDIVQEKTNLPTRTVSYKKNYKSTFCIFCEQFIVSKHFSRHLQLRHKKKEIVQGLLNAQSKKEKRNIIMVIRNKGNFQLKARNGTFIPKKCMEIFKNKVNDANYSICVKCKGHFRNTYLVRHYKSCLIADNKHNYANAKVECFLLSLETSHQEHIKKDPLKQTLINKLRLDDIGKTVISDPLIIEYGVQMLKTSTNLKKRETLVRYKMRERARLLIKAKKTIPLTSQDNIANILGQPLPENDLSLSYAEPEKEMPYQHRHKRPLSDLSHSDCSHTADKKKYITNKNKPSRRQLWSTREINLLKKHFSKYMSNGPLYPTGKEIKAFVEKFLKSQRSVAQVKSKIQNIRKLKRQ